MLRFQMCLPVSLCRTCLNLTAYNQIHSMLGTHYLHRGLRRRYHVSLMTWVCRNWTSPPLKSPRNGRIIPPCHYDKLRTALNEMEEMAIIRKSQSEYASPIVLVVKPYGDFHICNDFRWLNERTVKDAHPTPSSD